MPRRVLRSAGLCAGKQLLPGLRERVVGLKQNAASSVTAEVELNQPLNPILSCATTATKTAAGVGVGARGPAGEAPRAVLGCASDVLLPVPTDGGMTPPQKTQLQPGVTPLEASSLVVTGAAPHQAAAPPARLCSGRGRLTALPPFCGLIGRGEK